MANKLNFSRGLENNLPTPVDGTVRFCTDTGSLYIDNNKERIKINAGKADQLTEKRTISLTGAVTGAVEFDGSTDVIMNTMSAMESTQLIKDSEIAYSKDLPVTNVSKYATVTEIGGMSYKCENLIPFPYNENTKTKNGITFTVNNDGSVLANGTADENYNVAFYLCENVMLSAGNYVLSGIPSGFKSEVTITLYYKDDSGEYIYVNVYSGGNITFTLTTSRQCTIYLQVFKGQSVSNLTFYPMLNKGESALPYQPYFTGLRDSKVTAVESVGANLYCGSKTTEYSGNNITYKWDKEEQIITITSTSSVTTELFVPLENVIDIVGGETYSIKSVILENTSTLNWLFGICDSNRRYATSEGYSALSDMTSVKTYTFAKDAHIDMLHIFVSSGGAGSVNVKFKLMLNKGTTALPYSPYFKNTFQIPEAVQALEGYGQGISKEYHNKIVLDPTEGVKKFVKQVSKKVLNGSEAWVLYNGNMFTDYFDAISPDSSPIVHDSKFEVKIFSGASKFYVRTYGAYTVDTWKAYLAENPMTVVYQLLSPVETDLSDYFGNDNLIGVEAGGTITAVNEYEYDVPFTINYSYGKNYDVVSSEKFIGDLDGIATRAISDNNGNIIEKTYFPLTGGTFTGPIATKPNQYMENSLYGLNMNNSDIVGINGLYFEDVADGSGEGLMFKRSDNNYDQLYAEDGKLYFTTGSTPSAFGVKNTVLHSGNYSSYALPLHGIADTATKLATARTIALSGDVTGSTTFDGSGNVSITATVVDNSHNHEMNNITNASTKYINAGTVTRKTIVNEAKNSQGYISRVALGLSNPANAFSPALLSVGTNDAGTSWTDFVFGIDGSISSPKGSFVVSTGNVDTSSKPLGFSTRQSAISWGTLANSSYTCITRWDTANGGSVVFADKDGQTSMQIDGNFYQSEGNYKVLDTSTGLQLTGGTMSGQIAFPNNSSLYPLSFSASNGGALVDTYGNFRAASTSAQTWNLMDSGGIPRFSVKWATGDTTIEGALSTKGRVITNQGDSAKRQFNTIDTLYLVNRTLDWNANSYYQHVVLLLPVPTSNNFIGANYFEGKFMFWKSGGNMYDTVYVSLNCVYNQLNYHIHNYGQHNNWKLCVCTYGGISYYALKCPYHDNPYNSAVFHGHLNTQLNSGIIPQDIAYYDENSKSILNSEVYNSLTENLYTKYITSVSAKALISSAGGITANQMGNLTRATTTATYADSYHLTYTCVTAADAGSLPAIDNANGILTLNTHEGNYYHQLGFVSGDGGALYRRYFYSVAPNTTQGWYKILDSGNYSSYALPLSGGTLTGRLTASGKISVPSFGSSWVSGMTLDNASIAINIQNTPASYHPIIAGKLYGGGVWNLGTITNKFGFYGFVNGHGSGNYTDYYMNIDGTTGKVEIKTYNSNIPLMLTSPSNETCLIDFYGAIGHLGSIGFASANGPLVRWNSGGSATYTILDSNNYSSYALPLSGGTMTGPLVYSSANGSNKTSNYISAGGGYSKQSGKYGLKLLVCDQSDCQSGFGQDLTELGGGYELTIAGGAGTNGQGYISFATHPVNSTSYTRLGYFDNQGNFYASGSINAAGGITAQGMSLSGPLNTANGTYNKIGDDVSIGDINMAGTLGIIGQNGNTAIQLVNYGASTTTGTSATGVRWTCTGNGASTISGTTSGTFSGTLDGYSSSRFLRNLGGSNYITINVGGNANTYYPIVIDLVSDKFPMQFINISRAYYETAPSSWNNETHKGGLTLTLLWNGSRYWDGNGGGGPMYCVHKTETYTTMVAGLGNSTAGAVVWLRGGGAVYHIHSMNGTSATARVYLEGFTDSSSATFSPTTTISNIAIRWPGWSNNADSASNADKLDGYHGSASPTANTYILRDSSNYIWTNYIHSDTVNNENPAIGQVIVTNGSDGFYRKASLSHLKSSLGNMPASYAVCHDVRGVDRAPTYYTDRAVTAWFNETGTPWNGSWYSGLTVKGWSNGYCAWQLASYSSTGSPDDDLWYRAGTASNTWNGWRKIPTIKTITGSGAIGTITVANNTEYRYTGVTSLGINYPSGNFECWLRITVGSSAISLSFASGTSFIGTGITSLTANTSYEISIKDKVVIIKKVG